MSKDAEYYREKWKKCQERCEILEKENRWILEALKDFRSLRTETRRLQADICFITEPVGPLEIQKRRCLFCSGEISPYKRSDSHYCSTGCRNNANSYIAYHRKKSRVKGESE